jgi:hypothetical protein
MHHSWKWALLTLRTVCAPWRETIRDCSGSIVVVIVRIDNRHSSAGAWRNQEAAECAEKLLVVLRQ